MLVQVADGTSTHNELIRESYYQKTNPIRILQKGRKEQPAQGRQSNE